MTDALQPQDIFAPSNLAPLSEEEIAALQYAAFMDHLKEIASTFELERAERTRKAAEAQQAGDRLEGKALTGVLNRLGFPIADLPSNEYRAPDGVRFSLFKGELFTQAIEAQEPDRFYLRISFSDEYEIGADEDPIYVSRSFGDHRRMTAEHITDIQSRIPAAIESIKAEVKAEIEARAHRIAAAAAEKVEVVAGPQFRTEVWTLDQVWEQGSVEESATADGELAGYLELGWQPLNITVAIDCFDEPLGEDEDGEVIPNRTTYVHRVVTLTRQVAAEAVS